MRCELFQNFDESWFLFSEEVDAGVFFELEQVHVRSVFDQPHAHVGLDFDRGGQADTRLLFHLVPSPHVFENDSALITNVDFFIAH